MCGDRHDSLSTQELAERLSQALREADVLRDQILELTLRLDRIERSAARTATTAACLANGITPD